jgi:tetratricopeptide (TPR) repeat protein
MQYQEFSNRMQQASELMKSAHLQEAVDFLYLLFLSDISDLDKAIICTDLATVYDRLGNTEEAISWFDKGVDLEQNYNRFEALEQKAQYLAQFGRAKEAAQIYENLIKQPFVMEADKERMRKIIQTFLGQTTRQWK